MGLIKLTVVIVLMLILMLAFALYSFYMIFRILRKLGRKDGLILALPCLVVLALATRFFHYIAWLLALEHGPDIFDMLDSFCADTTISMLPIWAYPMATFVNLAIWLNFVFATYSLHSGNVKGYGKGRRKLIYALLTAIFGFVLAPLLTINVVVCVR